MITNEADYLRIKARTELEFERLKQHKAEMEADGMSPEKIEAALLSLSRFPLTMKHEIEEYERALRGQFRSFDNFSELGSSLVAIRLFKGITQKELADKLGTTVQQIARDEEHSYFGVTIEHVRRVLIALGAVIHSQVIVDFEKTSDLV